MLQGKAVQTLEDLGQVIWKVVGTGVGSTEAWWLRSVCAGEQGHAPVSCMKLSIPLHLFERKSWWGLLCDVMNSLLWQNMINLFMCSMGRPRTCNSARPPVSADLASPGASESSSPGGKRKHNLNT